MSNQNYGSYQKPGQSKAYLESWAERLKLPEEKEEIMQEAIKAKVTMPPGKVLSLDDVLLS